MEFQKYSCNIPQYAKCVCGEVVDFNSPKKATFSFSEVFSGKTNSLKGGKVDCTWLNFNVNCGCVESENILLRDFLSLLPEDFYGVISNDQNSDLQEILAATVESAALGKGPQERFLNFLQSLTGYTLRLQTKYSSKCEECKCSGGIYNLRYYVTKYAKVFFVCQFCEKKKAPSYRGKALKFEIPEDLVLRCFSPEDSSLTVIVFKAIATEDIFRLFRVETRVTKLWMSLQD